MITCLMISAIVQELISDKSRSQLQFLDLHSFNNVMNIIHSSVTELGFICCPNTFGNFCIEIRLFKLKFRCVIVEI